MADIEKVVAEEIKLLRRRLNYLEAVAKEYGKQAPKKLKKRLAKKARKMSEETKALIRAAQKKRWAKIKKG